jgi:hypothetical protein
VWLADWQDLVCDEHVRVDGTLIEARASHTRFRPKDEQAPPAQGRGRNPEVDVKGETRSNTTHASTTDPEARLSRQSANTTAPRCHMGHELIEHRHGLVVDVETTDATGTAEREATVWMLDRRPRRVVFGLAANCAWTQERCVMR